MRRHMGKFFIPLIETSLDSAETPLPVGYLSNMNWKKLYLNDGLDGNSELKSNMSHSYGKYHVLMLSRKLQRITKGIKSSNFAMPLLFIRVCW